MAEMLLLNPRRRKARKAGAKRRRKNPSAAQRANWARFARMARAKSGRASNPRRRRARRRNPITPLQAVTRRSRTLRRAANPIRAYRRRRNPIGGNLFNLRSYLAPIKEAAIQGAGAVGMDYLFGRFINPYLPASVRAVPGAVGVGDAIKMLITVALGRVLAKPTKGLSNKAAVGSLTVQFADITRTFLPPAMQTAGLGFVTAGRVVPNAFTRVNANRGGMPRNTGPAGRPANLVQGVGAYTTGTPLLSAYTQGQPLLSAVAARRSPTPMTRR